jgi:hypothetical protein
MGSYISKEDFDDFDEIFSKRSLKTKNDNKTSGILQWLRTLPQTLTMLIWTSPPMTET